MTEADCIVTNWYVLEVQGYQFLTGDVVEDRKGRWLPGDYMFSTVINSLDLDVGVIRTLNSVYALSGEGKVVSVTTQFALKMREGYRFEDVEAMLSLEQDHANTDSEGE